MTTSLLHTGRRSAVVGLDWTAWGICGRLVVTDPDAVAMARAVLGHELATLARSFRTTRAVRRAMRDLGRTPRMPDGAAIGPFPYGVTPADGPAHVSLPGLRARADAMPVRLRRGSRVRIGLGPSLRAWTAQRCAESAAEATGCGVLVAIGGDVATSGLAPAGGWRVELPGEPAAVLAIGGGAVSWIDLTRPGRAPRRLVTNTGDRALRPHWLRPHWLGAVVVAANTPAASTACSTALLSGPSALRRLADSGLLARLTGADGRVRDVGWWPGD